MVEMGEQQMSQKMSHLSFIQSKIDEANQLDYSLSASHFDRNYYQSVFMKKLRMQSLKEDGGYIIINA